MAALSPGHRHDHLIRRRHPLYPVSFEKLHDPPAQIFARGRLELLERPMLAIVGTRRCTREGREFTHEVAHAVVSAGGVVLSGLALGIDGAAHQGALPDTIAVLGTGLDVHQPPSHRRLQERIGAEGLLLTEYGPGEAALPWHFPQRNRLIAALAKVVLVIEAPARSGALITADHALDVGVDVIAVPAAPWQRTSAGVNALLRDGAGIVSEPRDVLDALGLTPERPKGDKASLKQVMGKGAPPPPGQPAPPGLAGDALAVWHAVAEPAGLDALVDLAGLNVPDTLGALFELEVLGLVRRKPGQMYERA